MNWIKILITIYCYFNGFKIKQLNTKEELKAAFDLKNRVNQSLSGLKPLTEEDEFIYPKGLAAAFGLFIKGQLVGTIQLMDLAQIVPYTSKMYVNAALDYKPEETYEVKSFVVDHSYQHGIGGAFNTLIYYAIALTQKTNRNQWLVVTSNTFYEKIKKRSGLPTTFISNEYHYLEDDSTQSRYCRNYGKEGMLKDYTCYYIHIPRGILSKLTLKFLRTAIAKTLRLLNDSIPLPKLLRKHPNYTNSIH